MSTIGEKIKGARLAAGISQNQLAKRAGISQAGLSAIESTTKSPSVDTLERIANALKIPLQELLSSENPSRAAVDGKRWIPVLGNVQAGIPSEAIENILDYEEIDEVMASSGEYFALQVRGDSMEPKFSAGDVVIVRKQDDADSGDIVVALVNGDSATIKRLKKQSGGILLIASNPSYDPLFYSNRDIAELPVRILGKVVELRAKF